MTRTETNLYRYDLVMVPQKRTYGDTRRDLGMSCKVHVNAADFKEAKEEAIKTLDTLTTEWKWDATAKRVTYLGVRVEEEDAIPEKGTTGVLHWGRQD